MNKLTTFISIATLAFSSIPAIANEGNGSSDFEQEVYMLEVSGVMTVNNQRVDDYTVYMFEDGILTDSFYIDNRREQFFGLELGHNYAMKFVKQGYKCRTLLIDTHLPETAQSDYFTFRYDIEFIAKDAKSNTFDDFPVAYITYDAKKKDFDYNRTYHYNVRFNAGQAADHVASENTGTVEVE